MVRVDVAPRLLRITEAAETLSISRSRAYQLASAGEMPGLVRIGGALRVDTRALERWIDQQSGSKPAG